jgi:hypothetical protein
LNFFENLDAQQDYFIQGGEVPAHLDADIEAQFPVESLVSRLDAFERITSPFIKMN